MSRSCVVRDIVKNFRVVQKRLFFIEDYLSRPRANRIARSSRSLAVFLSWVTLEIEGFEIRVKEEDPSLAETPR